MENESRPIKVLIVEDNPTDAKLVKKALKDLGFNPGPVLPDGESAVIEAGLGGYDLALIDVVLAGNMDGIDVAERIYREHNIPVILVSAHSDLATIDRAKQSESYNYILKPISKRTILPALKMALGKHQLERKLKESRQLYSSIMNRAFDCIVVIDADSGQIIMANPKMTSLLGQSRDELLQKKIQQIFPTIYQGDLPGMTAIIENGGRLIGEECLTGPDKQDIYLEISAGPVSWEERRAVCLICRDITERKAHENQLAEALAAKGNLLNELHHRVKNNLQIILSLISLQMDNNADKGVHEALLDVANRISAMSQVHQNFFGKGFANVELESYLSDLIRNIVNSLHIDQTHVEIETQVDQVQISLQQATTLGMVVNELVTNSLKHAFAGQKEGRLFLSLRKDPTGEDIQVTVGDDGSNPPQDIDLDHATTLGWGLVKTLVEDQLEGSLAVNRESGLKVTVQFKPVLDQAIADQP